MGTKTLLAYRSPEGRYRTEKHMIGNRNGFLIAEGVADGTLITEFDASGEILGLFLSEDKNTESVLRDFVCRSSQGIEIVVEAVKSYEKVALKATCIGCGKGGSIFREMDFADPGLVKNVPVVPLFRCTSCGKRYYSMTDEYLKTLVHNNTSLFSDEELEEKRKDEALFVKTLHEYIIRIFASKKISRVRTQVV